jgi:uncharacterized protein YxjI
MNSRLKKHDANHHGQFTVESENKKYFYNRDIMPPDFEPDETRPKAAEITKSACRMIDTYMLQVTASNRIEIR